ncbi:MAG: Protein TusB [Candidatus Erwinia impunctatus]|nr:Protein TusB [Culicoides impunctatus]
MLHTLSRSPYQCDLTTLLRLISADDDLLLIQDGVLAAIAGSTVSKVLSEQGITCYVLREDVMARGLTAQLAESVILTDYSGFVGLTVRHQQHMAW